MQVIGLDIGGANLKAAHFEGECRCVAFPIWQRPDGLERAIHDLIGDWLVPYPKSAQLTSWTAPAPENGQRPESTLLATTMTAELADCFQTKAIGVEHIVNHVEQFAASLDTPTQAFYWQTSGDLVTSEIAKEFPLLTAAANWHALATFVGRMVPSGNALLIDIGTTTCDIIPIENGVPMPIGRTDAERLASGELVYSGVQRTPLCAIAHSVPIENGYSQVAAEVFATMRDVYLLCGKEVENSADCNTANGKPATRQFAHDRIARQLCRDRTELTMEAAVQIGTFFANVQQKRIQGAIDRVLSRVESCSNVIISGSGAFVIEQIAANHKRLSSAECHSLNEIFSGEASTAACAYALARLGFEKTQLESNGAGSH